MKGFSKTRIPNLKRRDKTGVFYVFTRVGKGKHEIARSLDTTAESSARLLLPQKLAEIRASVNQLTGGKLTLNECSIIYLTEKAAEKDLKPKAYKYREETVKAIRLTFKDFPTIKASIVTYEALETWSKAMRARYSATRFNGMLQSFKSILDVAVNTGCLDKNPLRNPSKKIKQARVETTEDKEQVLYTAAQLELLFAELKRRSKNAWWFCRFLYVFTLRVDTARNLTPAMVNRDKMEFVIPAEFVKRGKVGNIVRVPIFSEMLLLLDEMDTALGKRDFILPIKDAHMILQRACKKIKLPVLTHHSFRHIFISHALEKGIDVRTLAKWVNHKDGGALLLRRYSHILDEQSKAKAAGLKLLG